MPSFSAVSNTGLSFWLPVGAAIYLTPERPARNTLSMKGNYAWKSECEAAVKGETYKSIT
jgi:hypothetical protein